MRSMETIQDYEWALENDPELIEEFFEKVTIEDDLKRYLKEMSENEETLEVFSSLERKKKRALGIHPSSACKKKVCSLKLYYECVDELEPKATYNPKSEEIWDLGTMIHDRLQTILTDMYGGQFQDEVPLSVPRLSIVGHTDGLFHFFLRKGKQGYRFILEIKSIKEGGNFGFAKVQKKPFDDNIRQAHFYMKALDVPFALIFYVAKNSGEFLEYAIKFDHELWDELEKTITPPVQASRKEKVRIKATPSWSCRWCNYEYACAAAQKKKGRRRAKTS